MIACVPLPKNINLNAMWRRIVSVKSKTVITICGSREIMKCSQPNLNAENYESQTNDTY